MRSSEVFDHTLGRCSNDELERTVAVHFKDEDEVDGVVIGPLWLQLDDEASSPKSWVPFRKGDEPEWHPLSYAEALARELGVKLVRS